MSTDGSTAQLRRSATHLFNRCCRSAAAIRSVNTFISEPVNASETVAICSMFYRGRSMLNYEYVIQSKERVDIKTENINRSQASLAPRINAFHFIKNCGQNYWNGESLC